MDTIHDLITASPVARALNIIGDRWSLLILRDVFLGRHRFEELCEHTGAPRGTLTKRLQSLVSDGVLYRNPYRNTRTRFEYRLTDKGLDLYPWALAIWHWEQRWGGGDKAMDLPALLTHRNCGQALIPLYCCGQCHEVLRPRDIRYVAGPGAKNAESALILGNQRLARTRPGERRGVDSSLFHVTDIIGDRRTALVVSGAFWGLRRFGDFQEKLSIATNVLTDRLKRLVDAGIFVRQRYQDSPPRYEYRATDKANDLYPIVLSLHQWGSRWLQDESAVLVLIHKCGAEAFTVNTVCNHCKQELNPGDVNFNARDGEPVEKDEANAS